MMASGWLKRPWHLAEPTKLMALTASLLVLSGCAFAASVLESSSFAILDKGASSTIESRPDLELDASRNLFLTAELPESLEVPDQSIHWQIKNELGVQVQRLQGQNQSLQLANGSYSIELRIGHFSNIRQVAIQSEMLSRPYFKADIGRLEVAANHAADWSITSLSTEALSFETKATQQLAEFVPTGFYEINPSHSGVARRQVVHVLSGDISHLHIDIPVVQVDLIAVENNQPFFKPVEWDVFRLEKGTRQHVGTYYLHSQGITVPTGYYEVVATHDSTVRSRQFWVKENTINKVILAMD
ncbi:MAG TPA: hypothetical protein PLM98_13360 [Thiolinea sp.]|nr:hypothetical protein [Thiolinea sp.]